MKTKSKKRTRKNLGAISEVQRTALKANARAAASRAMETSVAATNKALTYLSDADNMKRTMKIAGCAGLLIAGIIIGRKTKK